MANKLLESDSCNSKSDKFRIYGDKFRIYGDKFRIYGDKFRMKGDIKKITKALLPHGILKVKNSTAKPTNSTGKVT